MPTLKIQNRHALTALSTNTEGNMEVVRDDEGQTTTHERLLSTLDLVPEDATFPYNLPFDSELEPLLREMIESFSSYTFPTRQKAIESGLTEDDLELEQFDDDFEVLS